MEFDALDSFWSQVRSELDETGLDAHVEPMTETVDRLVTTWRVTLTSLGGVRVRAYLSVPETGANEPLPAVMYTPGYGGDTPHSAMYGLCYDKGIALLTLYPRGQGESSEFWQVPAGLTKLTMGLEAPDQHYYRQAYADCMRGIDFLASRPEIDSERIGVIGLSQGGGLTLAMASLDERVRCAVAHEPFLCNYPVAVETATTGPYLELAAYFEDHPAERERALETLAWFDPLTLAHRIACPTFISIGRADTTCPPETIRPVYDRIEAFKGLIEIPNAGHGWYYLYRDFDDLWLRRFL